MAVVGSLPDSRSDMRPVDERRVIILPEAERKPRRDAWMIRRQALAELQALNEDPPKPPLPAPAADLD